MKKIINENNIMLLVSGIALFLLVGLNNNFKTAAIFVFFAFGMNFLILYIFGLYLSLKSFRFNFLNFIKEKWNIRSLVIVITIIILFWLLLPPFLQLLATILTIGLSVVFLIYDTIKTIFQNL